MNEITITRCAICIETRSPFGVTFPFLEISQAYPVKLHGYMFNPQKGKFEEVLQNVFLCESHYNQVVKVPEILDSKN